MPPLLLALLIGGLPLAAAVFVLFTVVNFVLTSVVQPRYVGDALAGGVITVLFGVVLLASPGAGALVLLRIIGLSALALGIVFIAWAFRLRGAAGLRNP